ncbi:putative indole-3-pyruvate monooxygenase YUCCA4 [Echria macrotheca]|uniref:Indole-3-pyruvate monooxygenase YUCCA4 n=1 Tax=Echria macrotheca TaxID=438768 RepID=A0AAJ0B2R5_9PEZI|nr:putative indole-3-pyruvate monooxygenase YUCCA4 [Echria macrotheca]
MALEQTTVEYPQKVDLRRTLAQKPLPVIPPETLASADSTKPREIAQAVLNTIENVLAADDVKKLQSCFLTEQAYWRDQVGLTYHIRTFSGAGVVAANLLETKKLRGIPEGLKLVGDPHVIPVSPVLQWIDANFAFKTISPAAAATGRLLLVPVAADGTTEWKVWILSTWLDGLDDCPHDESLLYSPGRALDDVEFSTEVLMIGGGNSAAVLAARLKALGVDSVMLERNANPGDNWALRYDSLRFHVSTALCDTPYIHYPEHLKHPHLLTRDDLAAHLRRFISTFHLNIINSAKITSTVYDPAVKLWTVKFTTPSGSRTATAKHLVQATGIASQKPYLPDIPNRQAYKGLSMHSAEYKNPSKSLAGVKSVIIVGSANTAFDILEDCVSAGIATTMVARSPTYIVPLHYGYDPRGLGLYDILPTEIADRALMTLPAWVDGALAGGLFALLAAEEPDRYAALAKTGFPVMDGTHPDAHLLHNLVERGGGHYVDIGGTNLLVEGKAAVKAGTEPVSFTEGGLKFADGSELDADAVLWCTGFADVNMRAVAAEILGGGTAEETKGGVLGPREIAERMDATFGYDAEGEIRGLWKRNLRLENFWIMGGHTGLQRWYSTLLAMQIKAALAGILPTAYRETVVPDS